jgi:hypothetical protein
VNWQGCFSTVCVIADYFGKPKKSPNYFESEVAGCVGKNGSSPGRVFNACLLDSCSSLSLQVVDLILGGVRHSFLASREPGAPRDANKDAITMRIRQHVGPQILAASFTGQKPRYFGVRELTPREAQNAETRAHRPSRRPRFHSHCTQTGRRDKGNEGFTLWHGSSTGAAWVRRILLQKGKMRIGELSNVLRQSLVAIPEGRRGKVAQRRFVFPAL